MTFLGSVWAVDGNEIDAGLMRLMNQAATLGSQGVIGHLDCQVQPTSPATAGIQITNGGVAILGQEANYQGSYTGWNVGLDTTLSIAATGGSPRSDLVVVRAEDPTWQGSPWGGSPAGQVVFPRIISGVSNTTTTVPAGQSAIALARIDMPASTATVQNSYIHDLRQVAVPQTSMQVQTVAGSGTGTGWTVSTTPHAWPPGAQWLVSVPSWATKMVAAWWITDATAPANGAYARGYVNPILGSSVTSPNLSLPQTLVSVNNSAGTSPYRITVAGGASASISPTLRGTTQMLQFAQVTDGTNTGVIGVDEGSQVTIIFQFQQAAAAI